MYPGPLCELVNITDVNFVNKLQELNKDDITNDIILELSSWAKRNQKHGHWKSLVEALASKYNISVKNVPKRLRSLRRKCLNKSRLSKYHNDSALEIHREVFIVSQRPHGNNAVPTPSTVASVPTPSTIAPCTQLTVESSTPSTSSSSPMSPVHDPTRYDFASTTKSRRNRMATRTAAEHSKGNGEDESSPPPAKRCKKEKPQSPPVIDKLHGWAKEFGCSVNDLMFAQSMDTRDTLRDLRNEFVFPKMQELPTVDLSLVESPTEECIYMCGNSLGLQPKGVKKYLDNELKKWGTTGVHGHFTGDLPWALCDEMVTEDMAKLVGANKDEVAVMNGLTVNLHLLMISFYRPTQDRHKILIEDHAFPSDHYAVESQIRMKGYDPETSIITLKPRPGEYTLQTDDILELIEREGDSIALVMISGVQYYTGQFFDIKSITKVAHNQGCMVGWDLAHAIGNVPLKLNKWGVDFAVWCTYKYVNSGAGSLAGAFLHEKHAVNDYPKLLGWWGHRMETRFDMSNKHGQHHSSNRCSGHHPVIMQNPELDLSCGIAGYRVTNPSIMAVCPIRASLDIFNQTSVERLRMKSKALTGYLEYLIQTSFAKPSGNGNNSPNDRVSVEIITPSDPMERGSQLSLLFSTNIENIHKELMKRGVCCDERKPNVLRIAPAAIYNNFKDVWRFNQALHDAVNAAHDIEKVEPDGSELD